jgi:hypothetical protein
MTAAVPAAGAADITGIVVTTARMGTLVAVDAVDRAVAVDALLTRVADAAVAVAVGKESSKPQKRPGRTRKLALPAAFRRLATPTRRSGRSVGPLRREISARHIVSYDNQ